MSAINEQKAYIEDVETVRYITGTLRDISVIQLGALLKRFDLNTVFYNELTDLYRLVSTIAAERGLEGKKRTRGKSLFVGYTTNRHFYGSLNTKAIEKMRGDVGSSDEVLVIGETGRAAWQERSAKVKKVRYMSFSDDMPTDEEVRAFLKDVVPFDHVYVYYPKFVSVFEQNVERVDISYAERSDRSEASEPGAQASEVEFLLEPDVREMVSFFNTQVRYALFERILLETQLSRVAARLVKMDTADSNAMHLLERQRQTLRRTYTAIGSRQMLETVVGYLQWHKKEQPIVQ